MKSSRPLPESNEYADTEKLVVSGRYANLRDASKVIPNSGHLLEVARINRETRHGVQAVAV